MFFSDCLHDSVVTVEGSLHAGFKLPHSPHRGKGSRCQQLVADILHKLTVLLGFGLDRDPFGVGEERTPALLALSHAVPGKQVGEPITLVRAD